MQKNLIKNETIKKHYIVVILLLFAVILICILTSFFIGYEKKEVADLSYFEFYLKEDNTYSIRAKNIDSIPSAIILPVQHKGKPVSSIENFAFNGCKTLESIVIPEGVSSIGDSAFMGCSNLTTITIPNSITSVGNCAFLHCKSLLHNVKEKLLYLGNESNP